MTEEYKGYTITIEQDQDPFNPREDDNLGTMVCLHNRYDLGDEQSPNFNNADSWYTELAYYFNNKFDIRIDSDGYTKDYLDENDFTQIEKWIDKNIVWLPLYLYDHSGISISTTGWACGFDSGTVGFIWAHRDRILQEFGRKNLTELQKNRATDALVSEVESYDKYISGNIYAVNVHLDDELIDSCSGYDDYGFAEAEVKRMVDFDIKNTVRSYRSLPNKEMYKVANLYSDYIMDFDYDESRQPVSIYEFYDNEYQQLKEKDQHDY